MRILFFPSDRGGGFGHISRCLSLAREGGKRGHDCGFVLCDIKYEKRIKSYFPVIMAKPLITYSSRISGFFGRMLSDEPRQTPLYLGISGLDYQVLRDGLTDHQKIAYTLERYRKAVEKFKPDILVGDTNLLVWMLARSVGLPVVQIVRYASHPRTANLIWWQDVPDGIEPPNSALCFNPLLDGMGLDPISKAEDLLQGDLYIVPSIPDLEPIPYYDDTQHVGQLLSPIDKHASEHWNEVIGEASPLIYVTIGGGAGPVGNKQLFTTLTTAFSRNRARVIISTGGKFNYNKLTNIPSNISFFDWTPGPLLISKADLIMFHGGYNTMTESIACGKPTITLPFHSEQEGNGRRLEQAGCGLVAKLSRENYKKVDAAWKYGAYSFLIQNRFDLTPQVILEKVDEVLSRETYAEKARDLQRKMKEYGGAKSAISLIEKCKN